MRFEVPQFIEIEDKIIGPFTWQQFIFAGGGVGFATVLFFIAPFFIFVIFGLPFAGLGFLLGFYPVNDRPFSIFLQSIVSYFSGTRKYFWKKSDTGIYTSPSEDTVVAGEATAAYTPPAHGNNLHSLSRQLELKAMQTDS